MCAVSHALKIISVIVIIGHFVRRCYKLTFEIILTMLRTETPIPNVAMKIAGNFCLDQIGVSVSSFT